jgi:hypothetical protein
LSRSLSQASFDLQGFFKFPRYELHYALFYETDVVLGIRLFLIYSCGCMVIPVGAWAYVLYRRAIRIIEYNDVFGLWLALPNIWGYPKFWWMCCLLMNWSTLAVK